jgi:alpha-D-xyloside xylohydrolase
MRKIYVFVALVANCFVGNAQKWEKTSLGVKAEIGVSQVDVQFYSPTIVRVQKWPKGNSFDKQSLSVVKTPQQTKLKIAQNADVLTLKSQSMWVVVDLKTGKVAFRNTKGEALLMEKEAGATFTDFNDAGTKTLSVGQSFVLDKDEAIYGLGILQKGKMVQRNINVRMVQGNTEDFVTFFQSVKGYGLFWDNYSPTNFSDSPEETTFFSEVGDGIDYYFMFGANADGVVAQMRDLTGQAPMFPLWTYGYWQSKERYKSQDETVGVVKKYRDLGVPLDGIIQDWQYWGNNYLWNAMEFLKPEFPNPKKMVDDVHSLNAHIIISIWSSFGPQTKAIQRVG